MLQGQLQPLSRLISLVEEDIAVYAGEPPAEIETAMAAGSERAVRPRPAPRRRKRKKP